MAEASKIEWTDHTFNPWIGCTKVSPGCDHCYAQALMEVRHKRAVWGETPVPTSDSTWAQPLKWQRNAAEFFEKHGRYQRVFCSSLADVFDNKAPDEWRKRLADLIRATPALEWLLLTKRIGNALGMLAEMFDYDVPGNVRVGATIVNQAEAARDLRKVREVYAVTRLEPFLSMEPLLERVCLTQAHASWAKYVGWVIVGGESGPGARAMDPWAADALQRECEAEEVPFLFKQHGSWGPVPMGAMQEGDILFKRDSDFLTMVVPMRKMSKKAAGRVLLGRTFDGFPPQMVLA